MSGETEQDSAAAVKSGAIRRAPYHVIDGFLGTAESEKLLDHALAHETDFVSAGVISGNGEHAICSEHRQAMQLPGGLGAEHGIFESRIRTHLADIFAAVGQSVLTKPTLETDLAVHRDGHFYRTHIDTRTQQARSSATGDRVLSIVYYLHKDGAAFHGGALALHPLIGCSPPILIEPRHDRLVAFSSVIPHEVETVYVPGNAFDDARFSINCWVLRPHS